jgi:selenocysteine lyase/cysteine desulfurase
MMMPILEPPALYAQAQDPVQQDEQLQKAYQDFKAAYPTFQATTDIDVLRQKDYKRLELLKDVYLDYTGSGLYAESQVQNHMALLMRAVYGNPHSDNPTSTLSTQVAQEARSYVLKYFNASPDEYTVVFTPNATGALKLVGESYPFKEGSALLLTSDCHNSVSGIREFACSKGGTARYVPLKPNLRVDQNILDSFLEIVQNGLPNLFAFPAQSNFSGVQHPLEWIARAQAKGWDVLIDAAAFVPTNRLDLSRWHPDFVDISFYKMFGYPTGVGCLIVKHTALAKLKRPWFSGGTVEVVGIHSPGYSLHEGYAGFEDGTINFLGLSAIPLGLRHMEAVKVDTIHERMNILTDWLIKELLGLYHTNGTPLIRVYGPRNVRMRGGIVAMNFQNPAGAVIDPFLIEEYANRAHISVRTGCFCNPGSIETINGTTKEDIDVFFSHHGSTCTYEDYVQAMPGKTIGALRVSLGIVSNFADVHHFVQFARTFIDKEISAEECSRCCSKHVCNSSC